MMATIDDLDTPALVVDLDILEHNIQRLAEYCRQHGLKQRPHAKTHKTPAIAHKQLAAGAQGITVAKLGEAEVMADAGITDILIAYPIVGPSKLQRLARLACQAEIAVALDDVAVAQGISAAAQDAGHTIGVLIEQDTGMGRTGLAESAAIVRLAQQLADLPGLLFRGTLAYPGRAWVAPGEKDVILQQEASLLQASATALEQAGLAATIISGGSTPTAFEYHRFPVVNEIRAGNYVFNDFQGVSAGFCRLDDCALRVITTVVSAPTATRATVDAGSKTFTSDVLAHGRKKGYGYIVEYPEVYLKTLTEEHGVLYLDETSHSFKIGERVTIIPNHGCTTLNMFDTLVGVRGGRVEVSWPVAGRGKIQ
ncbi:MAG: D-TA family PLP-dependent enzyme [Chloroflexi bacterium]|nr:D-TA family PLP-dependent enzyme [Chloroflexota bacterium]